MTDAHPTASSAQVDPRAVDPRAVDPRVVDPRMVDLRTATGPVLQPLAQRKRRALHALIGLNLLLGLWYFVWLLSPQQVGTAWLYGVLVVAEVFNVVQAVGFWWTIRSDRVDIGAPEVDRSRRWGAVDVLVPVYSEPVDVVEATVAGAVALRGADVTVYLLDDGDSSAMRGLAVRYGAIYITRTEHQGAKAGNLNHALALTEAPLVAVFDCDHVPAPDFLSSTLGHFDDESVAFVQTPQYYANREASPVAAAAAAQQDLFFGTIGRGKSGNRAMFCCGTNFVFRRQAFESVGGFPEDSLTEDFELSMRLHSEGWNSVYVPTVLARGLGPEDMTSYVSQQARWAQGCLSALPRILRSGLPFRLRVQYLLSSLYFLSGWTVLVYLSLPILRIFGGVQPIHPGSANQFLVHFVPYFVMSLLTVAVASDGAYTFGAYSLSVINFDVHVRATARTVLRRHGRFVVTPKHGTDGPQPRAIAGGMVAISALVVTVLYALATNPSTAILTNVAFAMLWIALLACGAWPALGHRPHRSFDGEPRPVPADHGGRQLAASPGGVTVQPEFRIQGVEQ